MRVTSRFVAACATLAALAALPVRPVDAVDVCTDCPSGKTCILKDTAYTMPSGQTNLNVKICGYDASSLSSYTLTFSIGNPLECDPNGVLLPTVASLAAQNGCTAASCTLTVTLKQQIDWAILMMNNATRSALQARISSSTGNDETVQIAQGTEDTGGVLNGGVASSPPSVCSTALAVTGTRLSTLAECNKVSLCRGKASDTTCPTALFSTSTLLIDNVSCETALCTGSVALPGALPCDAAASDTNALVANVKVGNGVVSGYASLGTLSAAVAANITSVSGANVGSSTLTLKSDATCPSSSLNVTVEDLAISGVTASNGSILVALSSALTSAVSGDDYDISLAQCGVASKAFTTSIGEVSSDSTLTASATNGSTSSDDVGQASGTTTAQKEDASTGLSGGLYVAIGLGALAFLGFIFECWYHKSRHGKEHGTANGQAGLGSHSAV